MDVTFVDSLTVNPRRSAGCWVLVCSLLVVAGCSGSKSQEKATSNNGAETVAPEEAPHKVAPTMVVDKKTPQRISGVPLDVWPDVWFEDPLAVAGNLSGTAMEPPAESPPADSSRQPAPANKNPPEDETPQPANEPKWNAYFTKEAINREAKEIRLTLKQAFQSIQRYNGNYKELQIDASVLAVLAAITTEHSAAVTWKPRAPHIRDLSAGLATTATRLGSKNYKAGQSIYENLEQLLNGNTPGNLKPAAEHRPVHEIAERGALMKRMGRADQWSKENSGDEEKFKSEREQLAHEAVMIAVLMEVTTDDNYEMADEPEYITQAKSLKKAALDAAKAAEKANYANFIEARSRMTKACTACHLDFRFDDN